MECNFTKPIMDDDDFVISRQLCPNAATNRIIYMDASETFACDEHKNEAVLDAKDEFKKKKEVSSCELINPPVVECTDVKLVTSTSVTRVTDLETTLLEETIVYVKEAILGFLKDGQTAVDSLYIALKVYKEKLDVRGKDWEKILLDDFGIKSGAFRMWEFRNLNYLLTGKRTGVRDGNGGTKPKKEKKVPSGITAEQLKANANLKQAKEEFGAAAEAGNEQAKAYLAGYEKEAGITTTEIEIPKTSADTLYEILEKTWVTLIHEECENPPTKTEIETANEVWDTFIKWVRDTDMLDEITMNVGDLNAREATDMALHELAVKRQAAENAVSVVEPQAKKKRGRPSKKAAAQLRTEQFDALAEAAA